MDFIGGLPHTSSGFDAIYVIVHWYAKLAHFILIQMYFSSERLIYIHVCEIVCLHGVPNIYYL